MRIDRSIYLFLKQEKGEILFDPMDIVSYDSAKGLTEKITSLHLNDNLDEMIMDVAAVVKAFNDLHDDCTCWSVDLLSLLQGPILE